MVAISLCRPLGVASLLRSLGGVVGLLRGMGDGDLGLLSSRTSATGSGLGDKDDAFALSFDKSVR